MFGGAYGRDYKSKAAIVKDWLEGKDFKTAGSVILMQMNP